MIERPNPGANQLVAHVGIGQQGDDDGVVSVEDEFLGKIERGFLLLCLSLIVSEEAAENTVLVIHDQSRRRKKILVVSEGAFAEVGLELDLRLLKKRGVAGLLGLFVVAKAVQEFGRGRFLHRKGGETSFDQVEKKGGEERVGADNTDSFLDRAEFDSGEFLFIRNVENLSESPHDRSRWFVAECCVQGEKFGEQLKMEIVAFR